MKRTSRIVGMVLLSMIVWAISLAAIGSEESRASSLPERVYYAGIWGPKNSVATLAANVRIKSGDVKLRNVVVQGNLIIDKRVGEGDVVLSGVTVKGKTIVEGGGMYGVYISNSKLGEMVVQKQSGKVRIVASGSTIIASTQVTTSAILEERDLTSSGYENMRVNSSHTSGTWTTTLRGKMKSLLIETPVTFVAEKNSIVDVASITSKDVTIQGKITTLNIAQGLTAMVNGKPVSGAPLNNVKGTVTRGGVPYGNGVLEITKKDDMNFLSNATVDAGGQFELALDNGEYLIYGFHPNDGGEMIELRQAVTVNNGTAAWSIHIPAGSIQGTVYGLDGNLLTGQHVLELQYLGPDGVIDRYARVDNGHFSLLAHEGEYVIESVRSFSVESDMWFIKKKVTVNGDMQMEVRVPNLLGYLIFENKSMEQEGEVWLEWEGGQALVPTNRGYVQAALPTGVQITATRFYGNNGDVAVIGQEFVIGDGQQGERFIVRPYNSLTGKLLKADGSAYPNVGVEIESSSTGKRSFIQANGQGLFSQMLEDGKYKVISIRDSEEYAENLLDIPFEIADNKLVGMDRLQITVPMPNVHLSISRHDGSIGDGILALEHKSSDALASYRIEAVEGKVNMALPDGAYNLKHYTYANYDMEVLNLPVEVKNGVATTGGSSSEPYVIQLMGANVFGMLTDEGGVPIKNIRMDIIQTHDEAGNKIEGTYVKEKTNDLGEFEMILKPGTYRLVWISGEGIGHTRLNLDFQVRDTKWHAKEMNITLSTILS
ncbi:hypothetical protein ACFO9Q_04340 [Paenibacillus sp. GCM10023252]|uniref:hypothetical protein n=1 Tax=Paenibacillus sp. GCM10023252 TaxID=3252649 RepID=UPI003611F1E4